MSNPTALVQKLWNYCHILRDDSLSYGDYVEQLTFLEISGKNAARLPIPIPALDEQRQIVSEIEKQFTRLEAVVSANFQRATRLRQSILQKAFTGELV